MVQQIPTFSVSPIEQYLFVYGTLRPEFGHLLAAEISRHADQLGSATINGRLYRVSHYPGLIDSQQPDERVSGKVFRLHQADALLALLDDYEECSEAFPQPHEYQRVKRLVSLANGSYVEAWTYLYQHSVNGLTLIENGDFVQYARRVGISAL